MTIHPLLVHFPIAFLTIYSLIEILRFARIKNSPTIQSAKRFMLYAGVFFAFFTILAGAHDAALSNGPATYVPHTIVEIHSYFGIATFIWFGLIALFYLLSGNNWLARAWPKTSIFAQKVIASWAIIAIAVIGLAIVVLTGALGGAIVYSSTDQFGQFLLSIIHN